MKSLRSFRKVALTLVLAQMLCAPSLAAQTLPRLEADSLSGTHVVLPRDAAGKPLVLLLAYTKESEGDLTAWSRRLLGDHIADRAAVYVVVVADRTVFFVRKGLRKKVAGANVGSNGQKQSNVLITFDGTGWRELVPPGSNRTIGIVVCDASGSIVYAKREPFDSVTSADVENAVK